MNRIKYTVNELQYAIDIKKHIEIRDEIVIPMYGRQWHEIIYIAQLATAAKVSIDNIEMFLQQLDYEEVKEDVSRAYKR